MSNFKFLETDFKPLADTAQGAEKLVHIYPQASIMCARQSLEKLIFWLYKYDRKLEQPYDSSLYSLLYNKTFKELVPPHVWDKMDIIRMAGNKAVHGKQFHQVSVEEAIKVLSQLFMIYLWFERTYGPVSKDRSKPILFMPHLIPNPEQEKEKANKEALQKDSEAFEKELAAEHKKLRDREKQLFEFSASLEEREQLLAKLDADLAQKRAEIEAAKLINNQVVDNNDYNESETRKFKIDLLLEEAGWSVNKNIKIEVPVHHMPSNSGIGAVDYVLYDTNGLPLAVVEAKRTSVDPREGQQQAKLYADCLEKETGQRPIIFYTNGYQTHIWNDVQGGPPRLVHGFYTPAELKRLIERRNNNPDLSSFPVNPDIVGRYYQIRAIQASLAAYQRKERSCLLIMATGTGKTRTAIGLVDVLMRANIVQKVLFLADRTSLVKQAANAFKAHLPNAATVNLVEEKEQNGRLYFSTYQTMIGLIDQLNDDGTRKYGTGMFDLIIIDEAHRSVYQKYGEIFKYFDSLLLGLTATPRDEVDRDTYALFGLESGVPTDYYDLDRAIADGFLVPPKAFSVPLKFMREGIKYDELSEAEKAHWDSLNWGDEEEAPEEVNASQINKKLFNKDTIDKMLKHLMENGIKVEGGDVLGKTIIFAVNQNHANFIAERFNHHYPMYDGKFARVVTHATKYAQSLIDDFSKKSLPEPQIAISVDMLDTGIDVPEVVNLVFFKAVRSKVKFMQMIGRGTRLCEDLFAPGMNKSEFFIFDYCSNFEYFNENPQGAATSIVEPISQRLFKARVNILNLLNAPDHQLDDAETVRTGIKETLHAEVSAMNTDNFIVRTELENVEHFQTKEAWDNLDEIAVATLKEQISKLPNELLQDSLEAKLFDMLCYNLMLAVIEKQTIDNYSERIIEIAALLEEKANIPIVAAQIELIQNIQSQQFWEDITIGIIDNMRKHIRNLVKLIEKTTSTIVYTELADEIGEAEAIEIPIVSSGVNLAQYRKRVESFIKANENHITIAKLKKGLPLTSSDLNELEQFVFNAKEVENKDKFTEVFGADKSLPQFIRSLIGLDKTEVQQAFSKYLTGTTYNEKQIRFIEMIIDQLTQNGILDAGRLYEQPFIGINPKGVEGVFNLKDADEIFNIVEDLSTIKIA